MTTRAPSCRGWAGQAFYWPPRSHLSGSLGVTGSREVWDQTSAFLFDQSHIGPFLFENWMVVLGLPAFILCLWVLQSGTRL
jgi:hypothetical protein